MDKAFYPSWLLGNPGSGLVFSHSSSVTHPKRVEHGSTKISLVFFLFRLVVLIAPYFGDVRLSREGRRRRSPDPAGVA